MGKIMQGTMDSTFPISAITRYQIPNKIFLATLQKNNKGKPCTAVNSSPKLA